MCYRGTSKARCFNAVEDGKLEKESRNRSQHRQTSIRPPGEDFSMCSPISCFLACLSYLLLAFIVHSCCRLTMFHLQKMAISSLLFQSTLSLGLFSHTLVMWQTHFYYHCHLYNYLGLAKRAVPSG